MINKLYNTIQCNTIQYNTYLGQNPLLLQVSDVNFNLKLKQSVGIREATKKFFFLGDSPLRPLTPLIPPPSSQKKGYNFKNKKFKKNYKKVFFP